MTHITISNIKISVHYIVTVPTRKTGMYVVSTLCMYEVRTNKVMAIENPPVSYVSNHPSTKQNWTRSGAHHCNMSIRWCDRSSKHAIVGSIRWDTDYQEIQNFKVYQLVAKQQKDIFPFTLLETKPVCSSAELGMQRKINLDYTSQCSETLQALDILCEEYRDIFSLHQGDIGHMKLQWILPLGIILVLHKSHTMCHWNILIGFMMNLMLPVVIYITNGIISGWEGPLNNSNRGFTCPSTSYFFFLFR